MSEAQRSRLTVIGQQRVRYPDLVGSVFGRLTVTSYSGSLRGQAQWLCLCSCGQSATVPTQRLRSGKTKSCGCIHSPTAAELSEMVELYKAGRTFREVAGMVGRHRETVRRVLAGIGITRPPTVANRTYAVDESALDGSTPESRYWIGFILADGHVRVLDRGTKGDVTISLAKNDIGHVYSFRDHMRSSHPVVLSARETTYGPSEAATIRVHSLALARRLGEYGLHSDKTTSAVVPPFLTDCRDFWRGAIDGDGCLTYSRGERGGWHIAVSLCGTQSVCDGFAGFATRAIGPPPKSGHYRVRQAKGHWRVTVTSHQALRIADVLYSDAAVSLPRKKATAEAFGALAANL